MVTDLGGLSKEEFKEILRKAEKKVLRDPRARAVSKRSRRRIAAEVEAEAEKLRLEEIKKEKEAQVQAQQQRIQQQEVIRQQQERQRQQGIIDEAAPRKQTIIEKPRTIGVAKPIITRKTIVEIEPKKKRVSSIGLVQPVTKRFGDKRVGEEKVPTFTQTPGGTIITDESGVPTEVTKRDLLTQQEIIRGLPLEAVGRPPEAQAVILSQKISKETQQEVIKKIESGEITTKQQAEDEAQKIFKEKSEKASKLLTDPKTFLELEQTSGRGFREGIKKFGKSALFFIPGGGTIGGALALRDLEQVDIEAVKKGASIKEALRPSRRQSIEASLFFGSELVRGVGRSFKLAKEVRLLQRQELVRTPFETRILEVGKGKDVSGFRIVGRRQTVDKSIQQEVDFLAPVFRTGETKTGEQLFSVTGGRGVSRTSIIEFPTGREQLITERLGLFGKGVGIKSKAIVKSGLGEITFEGRFTQAIGRGGIIKKGKTRFFEFGGVGADKEQTFEIITGELAKKRLTPKLTISLTDETGQTLERTLFKESTFFKPGSFGRGRKLLPSDITIIKPKTPDLLFFDLIGGKPSDIGKLSLKQIQQQEIVTRGGEIFGVRAISQVGLPKIIEKPILDTKIISAPAILGLKQEQSLIQEVGITPRTKTRQKSFQKTFAKLESKTKQTQRQIAISKTLSKLESRLGQKQVAVQRTKQQQKQVQILQQRAPFLPSFDIRPGGAIGFVEVLPKFGFPKLRRPKRKPRGRVDRRRLPTRRFFTPGFTAKALGLTQEIEDVGELFDRREFGVRVRRIPVFKRRKGKKKKKSSFSLLD